MYAQDLVIFITMLFIQVTPHLDVRTGPGHIHFNVICSGDTPSGCTHWTWSYSLQCYLFRWHPTWMYALNLIIFITMLFVQVTPYLDVRTGPGHIHNNVICSGDTPSRCTHRTWSAFHIHHTGTQTIPLLYILYFIKVKMLCKGMLLKWEPIIFICFFYDAKSLQWIVSFLNS